MDLTKYLLIIVIAAFVLAVIGCIPLFALLWAVVTGMAGGIG